MGKSKGLKSEEYVGVPGEGEGTCAPKGGMRAEKNVYLNSGVMLPSTNILITYCTNDTISMSRRHPNRTVN